MEKLNNPIFQKGKLSNNSLSHILGGYAQSTSTQCSSSTCNETTGVGDTRYVTTNDKGEVTQDMTVSDPH